MHEGQRFTPAQDIVLGKVALHAQEGCWRSRDALWRVTGPALVGIACRRSEPFAPTIGYDDAAQEAWLMYEALVNRWQPQDDDGGFILFLFGGFGYRMTYRYRTLIGREMTGSERRQVVWARGLPGMVDGRRFAPEGAENRRDLFAEMYVGMIVGQVFQQCGTFDRMLPSGVLGGKGSVEEVAAGIGVSARTARRRWAALREMFRATLRGDASGDDCARTSCSC